MIDNYFQYNKKLASAAQPTADQLADLKDQGWQAVVNLSPASTKNVLAGEAAQVEALGMDYVHFPVDCSSLRPVHYHTFRGILQGLGDRRVFVHCGGNIKSSNLIHLYQVLELGIPETESLAQLKSIQNPEAKWFAYFEQMGLAQGATVA